MSAFQPSELAKLFPTCMCQWCGKQVRVRPERGDWLNAVEMVKHRDCKGSYSSVPMEKIIWPAARAAAQLLTGPFPAAQSTTSPSGPEGGPKAEAAALRRRESKTGCEDE